MEGHMSFTDQKHRVATEEHVKAKWGGVSNGKLFRCYLCGYKFKVGDTWRWVCSKVFHNFLVCEKCDGPDINEKWAKHIEELKTKYWFVLDRLNRI